MRLALMMKAAMRGVQVLALARVLLLCLRVVLTSTVH